MPEVFGTTTSPQLEVITAYVAGQQVVAAQSPISWQTVGAFHLPVAVEGVRLELIGIVSSGSNSIQARLYDVAEDEPVSGSDTPASSATTEARSLSGLVDLAGGRIYRFQVAVVGASGSGTARSVQLLGA